MKYSWMLFVNMPKIFNVLKADGPNIDWVTLGTARQAKKPMLVYIHKPDCPNCQRLGHQINKHPGIANLAPKFSMVLMQPTELPQPEEDGSKVFYPDGGRYVPRILFFDQDFNLLSEITGPDAKYQYAYFGADNIEYNMRRVLAILSSKG